MIASRALLKHPREGAHGLGSSQEGRLLEHPQEGARGLGSSQEGRPPEVSLQV